MGGGGKVEAVRRWSLPDWRWMSKCTWAARTPGFRGHKVGCARPETQITPPVTYQPPSKSPGRQSQSLLCPFSSSRSQSRERHGRAQVASVAPLSRPWHRGSIHPTRKRQILVPALNCVLCAPRNLASGAILHGYAPAWCLAQRPDPDPECPGRDPSQGPRRDPYRACVGPFKSRDRCAPPWPLIGRVSESAAPPGRPQMADSTLFCGRFGHRHRAGQLFAEGNIAMSSGPQLLAADGPTGGADSART